jgi:hypothetical protein
VPPTTLLQNETDNGNVVGVAAWIGASMPQLRNASGGAPSQR